MAQTYVVWVKEAILPHIKNQTKNCELRTLTDFFKKIKVGDILIFNATYPRQVAAITLFNNIEEVPHSYPDPDCFMPNYSWADIFAAWPRLVGKKMPANKWWCLNSSLSTDVAGLLAFIPSISYTLRNVRTQ